jgi:hypothetical protein
MYYYILALFFAVVIGILYYMEVFSTRKATTKVLPGFTFIYHEYRSGVSGFTSNAHKSVKEFFAHNIRFDRHTFCGIFFDDPSKTKRKNSLRYAYGIMAEPQDVEFIIGKMGPLNYKSIELPTTEAAHISYAYRNVFSFYVSSIFWRKINAYVRELDSQKFLSAGIEVYDTTKGKKIDLYLPIGNPAAQYNFSSLE